MKQQNSSQQHKSSKTQKESVKQEQQTSKEAAWSKESDKDQKQYTNVPSFLLKTYDIVNDPIYDKIICWNETDDGFIVKQPNEFAEKILPLFFKHNNFSSFVRQLNMYDFHKTRNNSNEHCFQHNLFKKNQKKLLVDIKRKNAVPQAEKMMPQSTMQQNNPQLRGIYPPQYQMYPGGQQASGLRPAIEQEYQDGQIDQNQIRNSNGSEQQQPGGFQRFMENPDVIKQFMQNMEQRQSQLEEKLKFQDQKLKEYQLTNQNLWQEICKSREREQSLEKLFVLAFTCIAQANGYNLGAPRELMNQQYIAGQNQNPSAGRTSSAAQNIPPSSDQLVLRQENSSDLLSLIQKILNQPGLINQLLSMSQTGFKSTGQNNTSDIFAGANANLNGQIGQQSNQQTSQGLSLLEQLAKGLNTQSNPNLKQNIQQLLSQLDADAITNLNQTTANTSANRGLTNQFGGQNNFNHSSRTAFTPHQQSYQRLNFPQITNQSLNLNTPPNMSPNPYAYDEFDKNSFKNLFQRTVSEYSFDHNNFHTNPKVHIPQPQNRASRTNSLAHSIGGNSDDASLFINKEQALSEADSDDHRKRLTSELKKSFENYLNLANQNQSNIGQGGFGANLSSNEYASNHHVEFETLSNSTNNSRLKQVRQISDTNSQAESAMQNLNGNHSSMSILGKRAAAAGFKGQQSQDSSNNFREDELSVQSAARVGGGLSGRNEEEKELLNISKSNKRMRN
eukprot:403332401